MFCQAFPTPDGGQHSVLSTSRLADSTLATASAETTNAESSRAAISLASPALGKGNLPRWILTCVSHTASFSNSRNFRDLPDFAQKA